MSDYFTWVKAIWITARGTPISFADRDYLVKIYQDQHPDIVYMKAAQMGMSEKAISEAIWVPDVLGKNVLYTFPSMVQLQDFVQARIDPVVISSEYLWSRTEQEDRAVRKIGLKRFGKGHLYLRGSQNEKQIITVDADMIVLDERDRFDQDNVPYIDKRLLASNLKWRREISTPTIPGIGIHAAYLNSDQRVYEVMCKACGDWQELDFFVNVDFEKPRIFCRRCKKDIERLSVGRWRALKPDNEEVHGYKINGIYNPQMSVVQMVGEYNKAQLAGFSALQQFYNQVLGYPYEVSGQSLRDEELDACRQNYNLPVTTEENTYVGCDIGVNHHHVVVLQKLSETSMKLVWTGTVNNFFGPYDSIESVISRYKPKYCVIDRKPETASLLKLMEIFPHRIYAADYPTSKFTVQSYFVYDDIKMEVKIDRTISLDYLISDIQNRRIELPNNIRSVEGFYDQLCASVRITERNNRTGADQSRYVEKGADHFMHALNYARICQIRGTVGKALLDYYVKPEKNLAPGIIDWLRVSGKRIF